ncbi:MAG: nitroreductase [Candidatus Thorarchaeota archaeon]
MALLDNLLVHGFIFAFLLTLYLLIIMRSLSPRIWGFSDYPKEITDTVPPQTKKERQIGAVIGIPFFILALGAPIISTLILESSQGGVISLLDAFLNAFGILMFFNFADLVILDWLIVGTITPDFVIIAGTEHMRDTEYKNFRISHGKGHIWATIGMAVLSLIIAVAIVLL